MVSALTYMLKFIEFMPSSIKELTRAPLDLIEVGSFRLKFCKCKAIFIRGQIESMRWKLFIHIMLQVPNQSLHQLTGSPAPINCANDSTLITLLA